MIGNRREEDQADLWLREHDPYYLDKSNSKKKKLERFYETPEEEKLLREYAKNTRNSYNIIEAGGELEHEDLIRLHEEAEQKLIAEAEQRKKARAEEKRRKKEQHDFYDLLRM